jgi:hypothetical protein
MSHRFTHALLAAGAALLIGQASAVAQPPAHAGGPDGQDRGGTPEHHAERSAPTSHYHLSTRERLYIQDWYRRNLPPGLAKQGKVPPGHARRLERGSPWPPQGIDYEPLPRELVRNLAPLPDHLRYFRVGTDVVIADMAGRVVSDVVYDALNR